MAVTFSFLGGRGSELVLFMIVLTVIGYEDNYVELMLAIWKWISLYRETLEGLH